jgi:hypothetical protein
MEPTSSASPAALERYGRAGASAGAQVEAAARRLEAALANCLARCREYSVPGLHGLAGRVTTYGRHEAELATWAATVGQGFLRADVGALRAPLGPPPRPPAGARLSSWDQAALRVTATVWLLRHTLHVRGLAGFFDLLPLLMPELLVEAGRIGLKSARYGGPYDDRDDRLAPAERLPLLLQGFWHESMAHLEPAIFRRLGAEVDALNSEVAFATGRQGAGQRTPLQAEDVVDPLTGALGVGAAQAFPVSGERPGGLAGPFAPHPAEAMAGDHSGVSYFPGEQVRLERLNGRTGDYRISIAGFDPSKPGVPNNMEAVALTAQGVSDGNHYYELVKGRFLADLARIPPGSTLHMEGHSMGGGMCFLLRDDPEVARALAAAGVIVGSVITYGAVRPNGPAGEARDDAEAGPFSAAEDRHYVNQDDSLALNVGAGHAGDPNVIMLANGTVDDPTTAHSGYGEPAAYAGLPPDLLALPYTVDPATYTAYAPLAPQPTPTAPSLSPAPTPAP